MSTTRRWARRAVALVPLAACAACTSNDHAAGTGTGGGGTARSSAGVGGAAGPRAGFGGAGQSGAAGSAGGAAGGPSGTGVGGVAGGSAGGAGASGAGGGGAGTAGKGSGGEPAGSGAGGDGVGGRAAAGAGGRAGEGENPVSLTIFDEVVFYDGYANVVLEPLPAGVERLRNDLITRQLSDAELDSIQSTLHVEVVLGALCDNYDRIGSVALALVPKGASSYEPDNVERLEVGRFVTPFMDWNKQPDQVPYEYDADHLVPVLHDAALRAEFDLWLELELFGVPYAANTEVSGCADRNDVFRGSLTLDSDSTAAAVTFDHLIPLAYKESFNNYERGASDMTGTTRKTVEFVLDAATADTQLVLITSNHGANTDGEEYSRRDHFVYVDQEQTLMYKPGRASCEPFRKYNTQANGIYGSSPRTDSTWQSFSNWCPGDVIDTRIIPLGPLGAGSHEFVLDVPDAEFVGGEGNFPFSLYVQSRSN